MTKYADGVTCSIPVGPNVNDHTSREVKTILWAVKNLLKLNLSNTKEIVIRGRTLPHPDEILDILNVSFI